MRAVGSTPLRSPSRASEAAAFARPSPRFLAPFAGVTAIGLASALLPPYSHPSGRLLVSLVVLLLGTSALFAVAFLRPRRTWVDPVAAYLLFPIIALAREAAGGAESGLAALVLVPLLWLAMTGTRRELLVASVLAASVFILPQLLHPDQYTSGDWRRAITWVAIALGLAPLVQNLVRRLARETGQALELSQQMDQRNRELWLLNERSQRLFEDAPHGVALVGTDHRILDANAALEGLYGGDPVGIDVRTLATPDDEALEQHLERLAADEGMVTESEAWLRRADGNDIAVSLSSRMLRHEDPDDDFVLVNVVDVSERRRYEDRLAHLADHDVLTGLANRRRFEADLDRHLQHCTRYGPDGALLLLDLDHFKQVNDSLGHGAGDELLIDVAGLLRRAVRSGDLVARLGGDEFAILLSDGDQADAVAVAERVVGAIGSHAATLDGVRRRVTASVGVVSVHAAAEHPHDILALADLTMYDAKDRGRDQVAVLAEGDLRTPRLGARLAWQNRIEEALDHDAFVLHLQPIQRLSDDRVSSAEALIRLADGPELVPPSRFLYIAERVGLAPRLDAWVIEHAVAMLARLRRHDPEFTLEVNLSGHSIGDPMIEETIVGALARHGVEPQALILEITETAAVSDVQMARGFAERISALGCQFALDDFGAGFGSFYYLKHLVFDYVKIDGEFVANSHASEVDRTIMRSIVGIARDLGKRTVAEFVSAPQVLDVVRAEGVDLAQGYLIGPPAPFGDFVATFLAARGVMEV